MFERVFEVEKLVFFVMYDYMADNSTLEIEFYRQFSSGTWYHLSEVWNSLMIFALTEVFLIKY